MRKLFITTALLLMPALFFAQDAFDKFEKDVNVTSVIVGKKTFTMLANTKFNASDENTKQGVEMIKQITGLRIFTTQEAATAAELKSAATQYAKSVGLEDLMQLKESGSQIRIMVKDGATESQLTEILVLVTGSKQKQETMLISVTGNFNLDQISEMLESKTVTGDKKADEDKFTELKNALKLKVYPNPASDVFYIDTDQPSQVKLYDLSGRLVKELSYTKSGIPVSGLAPATYVVEITTGDKRQTERIVIK